MKTQSLFPMPLVHSSPASTAAVMVLLAATLGLTACGKQGEEKTAGQKLDSAIAKTTEAAAEAKAKAESGLSSAGTAMKDGAQKAETAIKGTATSAGEKMDDMGITAAVSAGLAKDSELSMRKIDVRTREGVVTLTGSAPTEAAREKAAALARGVKGVSSVDNQLIVKAG